MSEGLMTPTEAANYLRLAKSSIYRKVAGGSLPHHRIGRLLRFRRSELDSWLEDQTNQAHAATPEDDQ